MCMYMYICIYICVYVYLYMDFWIWGFWDFGFWDVGISKHVQQAVLPLHFPAAH